MAEGEGWHLRWFTPKVEVPLCGHATLATAWLISERLQPGRTHMTFASSGRLDVKRAGDVLTLDFPSRPPWSWPQAPIPGLAEALGRTPRETYASERPVMCVFDSEDDIRAMAPDMAALVHTLGTSVLVTAPGKDCDFVSRYFAPRWGNPEDPVTGSAHCVSVPYWAKRLGKSHCTQANGSRSAAHRKLDTRFESGTPMCASFKRLASHSGCRASASRRNAEGQNCKRPQTTNKTRKYSFFCRLMCFMTTCIAHAAGRPGKPRPASSRLPLV